MKASAENTILCLWCGNPLRTTIEEDTYVERPEQLLCGDHVQELKGQELDSLWEGIDSAKDSPALFEGKSVPVLGVWEQGPSGCYAVYLLLGDGDLIMFGAQSGGVYVDRVGLHQRRLERPIGVPVCTRLPWITAMKEGWRISYVRADEKNGKDTVEVGFTTKGWLRSPSIRPVGKVWATSDTFFRMSGPP